MLELAPAEKVTVDFTRKDGKVISLTYAPDGNIKNRLWIPDRHFETEAQLVADAKAHETSDAVEIDFSKFYQEIVADG